jgi:hypothetical protein
MAFEVARREKQAAHLCGASLASRAQISGNSGSACVIKHDSMLSFRIGAFLPLCAWLVSLTAKDDWKWVSFHPDSFWYK